MTETKQLWTDERMIAEAEALAADWRNVLQAEQVRVLRQDVLKLLRLCTSQEGRYYIAELAALRQQATQLTQELAGYRSVAKLLMGDNQKGADHE